MDETGQSHLAFLDESEQGSAILRDAVGGFSSGAKAAFGVGLMDSGIKVARPLRL
jgi:hypothetical protein